MVSCKFCDSTNSIDSAFCKRCGRVIPEDEIKAAKVKLEIQIAEGFSLLSEGQVSEALAIADSVLSDDPATARGWSLRGHALERKGELRGAFVAYQNALRYDPESASDKIKVSQLQGAGGRSVLEVQPNRDRRTAIAAGLATCFLAIAFGAIAATRSAPAPTKTANLPLESQAGDANYTYFPQTPKRQQPENKSDESGSQGAAGQSVGSSGQSQAPASPVLPAASTTLPQPASGSGISGNLEVRPIDPSAALLGNNPKPPVAEQQPGEEEPEIEVTVGQEDPKEPKDGKGYISINLSGNNGVAPANTQLDANGIEALVRTARSQYQVGNYEAAASTYERALASGADPTQVNQRLAQCYEKLGRQSDAVQAYQRSIQALEKAIASGKGDRDRLTTALDSSKQALKVLQGG